MNDTVLQRFQTVLDDWHQMKNSDTDEASEDADRFQLSFYAFTEELRKSLNSIDHLPTTVDEARDHPEFAHFFETLPEPLQLPFEMELDDMFAGVTRDVDSTEQS